jgi:hypothetical protein
MLTNVLILLFSCFQFWPKIYVNLTSCSGRYERIIYVNFVYYIRNMDLGRRSILCKFYVFVLTGKYFLTYNNNQKLEIGILTIRLGIDKQLRCKYHTVRRGGKWIWAIVWHLPPISNNWSFSDARNPAFSQWVKIATFDGPGRKWGPGAEPPAFEVIGLDRKKSYLIYPL